MRDVFREIKEYLRYLVDRAFAREFTGQMLLFMVLVVSVTVVGMTAIFVGLFHPDNEAVRGIPRDIDRGFWDSMWWSLQQVLRLPGFERMYGATAPVLAYALFLSIMGLAVFGILVSMINTAMTRRIEALRKGDTLVKERGHVLILGWNNKVLSVLHQLAQRRPGTTVVILAPRNIDDMQESLRVAGILKEKVTVILRTGVTSNRQELERVACARAACVIVLSSSREDPGAGRERERPGGDGEAIKTIMQLVANRPASGEGPTLTAEIELDQNRELALIGARGRAQIVSSSAVISRVIVQSLRNPGLSGVYRELLAPDGNNLFVEPVAGCVGRTLGEVAYGFTDAVPIGISWTEQRPEGVRHAAGLNPGPDYDLAPEEQLVLLSRSRRVIFQAPDRPYESTVTRQGGTTPGVPARVLIIGWNGNLADILRELDAHASSGTRVAVLSAHAPEEASGRIYRLLENPLRNLALEFHQGDAVESRAYANLDLGTIQGIVVLADEQTEDADADARSLRTLLRLSDLRRSLGVHPHVVVELLDGTNRELLTELEVGDVIVSPEIVSAQLAQIARQPILSPIYRELLSAGGVEISLRPAADYVEKGQPCRFHDLSYSAHQKLEIALGLKLRRNDASEVLLNPARDEIWELTEADRVVVLAQQVYR